LMRVNGFDAPWLLACFTMCIVPERRPRGARQDRGEICTIIVNAGDQESDLAGGYAERAYKLPNPFYYIP